MLVRRMSHEIWKILVPAKTSRRCSDLRISDLSYIAKRISDFPDETELKRLMKKERRREKKRKEVLKNLKELARLMATPRNE